MFKRNKDSKGENDSNYVPGDSDKTLKQAAKQAGLKGSEFLKGLDDRGSGWTLVKQQMLYFAEFAINSLYTYSSVLILLQHFLLPSWQYEINGKLTT